MKLFNKLTTTYLSALCLAILGFAFYFHIYNSSVKETCQENTCTIKVECCKLKEDKTTEFQLNPNPEEQLKTIDEKQADNLKIIQKIKTL